MTNTTPSEHELTPPREVSDAFLQMIEAGWKEVIGIPDPTVATEEQLTEIREKIDNERAQGRVVHEFGPPKDDTEAWRVYSKELDKFLGLDRETGVGFEE